MKRQTDIESVTSSLNDIAMCGGELSYRAEDLQEQLPANLTAQTERRIQHVADTAIKLVNSLGKIREELGLEYRPGGNNYEDD